MKSLVSLVLLILVLSTSSYACPCDISSTQNKIESNIEKYVSENINALEKLNTQLKANLKELKNRTNNIEKESYLTDLKNKISRISGSQNIAEHRLLEYRNTLFFSQNGIIQKTDELQHLYSLVKSLEDIDITMKLNQGGLR